MALVIIALEHHCGETARRILTDLPEWFGLPQSVDEYVGHVEKAGAFVARDTRGEAVGFLSLKCQTEATSEILVMGVMKNRHRMGIGQQLIATANTQEASRDVGYLSVKTLAPTHPDPHYKKTRDFFLANGFDAIEIFPELWDADNPCLLMIKPTR